MTLKSGFEEGSICYYIFHILTDMELDKGVRNHLEEFQLTLLSTHAHIFSM